MALPATQKQWLIAGNKNGLDELQFRQGPIPKLTDNGVLVKLHAAALNYRDIIIPRNQFPYPTNLPVVGGSDGAGEVMEVGPLVKKWKKGDRVATLFNPGHQFGPLTKDAFVRGGVGATEDGTFQEYGVFDETGLVRLASNLSYLEGASLSDAAVTAWNALYGLKPMKPGDWVLTQGTGGVSLFAIQFAKAGGGRVIATTSSATKAEVLKQLGADHIINYREDKEWGTTARNLTENGDGVDYVVEVIGAHTMHQSLKATKIEGTITIIGLIEGLDTKDSIAEAVRKIVTLRGIHVGSRVQMEDMMAAMEANKIQPVLDKRIFALEELREAIDHLEAQKHVGKVVIKII